MRTRTEIETEMKTVAARGREINRLQNEGGEGCDHTDCRKLAALQTELDAAIKAEWTPEVTAARRATWNAAARTGKYRTPAEVAKATGIDYADLTAAIRRNGM